jgi:hypothetical protein
MEEFKFKCSCCEEIHKGIPTFGAKLPIAAFYIPEEEREDRVDAGDNDCVIDKQHFFLRGCIEIPVKGYDDPFIWGAWVSVREEDFIEYVSCPDDKDRSCLGPYYGYLSGHFSPYQEDCEDLRIIIHPLEQGARPLLELEKTDHKLSIEQHNGVPPERVAEIYEIMVHQKNA